MPGSPGRRVPRATYRVQLHAGFTLDDAAALVPYLAELGFSHLYTSPVLQAAPGSTHGYDVVDHSRVSAELGGADAFDRLTDALRAHGMGLVLDIVPNHMAISADENRWWWDVLEHGPASRYAAFFDVDLADPLVLPVLPDDYGRILGAGGIRLIRDGGRLLFQHGDRRVPLDPASAAPILDRRRPGCARPRHQHRRQPSRRAAGAAALPAGVVAGRLRRPALSALLRRERPDRASNGGRGGLRRGASAPAGLGRAGARRRAAGRPSRRAARPGRLPGTVACRGA